MRRLILIDSFACKDVIKNTWIFKLDHIFCVRKISMDNRELNCER